MTFRAPTDRLARINARAKAAGLSRTQYLLDRGDPEGATERATKPADMAEPTVACTHPRDQRNVLAWGTLCEACGVKIR